MNPYKSGCSFKRKLLETSLRIFCKKQTTKNKLYRRANLSQNSLPTECNWFIKIFVWFLTLSNLYDVAMQTLLNLLSPVELFILVQK